MAPLAIDSEFAGVSSGELQVKSPKSPLPKVQTFDAETAMPDNVVAALRAAGGCVVKGLVPLNAVRQIERDVRPFVEADQPWAGEFRFLYWSRGLH